MMPLHPQTGWGLGGREGRAQRQEKRREDLLFFLLQVKRKQSGKWSVRAVSRRGARIAPRLPPSRLTRAQRRRSQRPPARAAPAPASRAGTGKRSPLAASARWGRGPGPGTSGDPGEPRDRLADFSRRVQPMRPALCARPRPGPGPRLCAGSGPPPERPPRGVRPAPLRLDCLPRRAGRGSPRARRRGYGLRSQRRCGLACTRRGAGRRTALSRVRPVPGAGERDPRAPRPRSGVQATLLNGGAAPLLPSSGGERGAHTWGAFFFFNIFIGV